MKTSSVAGVLLHADPIAQDGAARDRAGWVDGQDGHGPTICPGDTDERRHERGLAAAGRTGDADEMRSARGRIEHAQGLLRGGGARLDGRQQASESQARASTSLRGQSGAGGRGRGHAWCPGAQTGSGRAVNPAGAERARA